MPVICKLIPGKAVITEKMMDIGIVNISKQVSVSITLQNKSNLKPLYYELLLEEVQKQTDLILVSSEQ